MPFSASEQSTAATLRFFLFLIFLVPFGAQAESPPSMPLPPCENAEGERVGACPNTSDFLSGTTSGPFATGSTITVFTVPDVPVCDEHIGFDPFPWSPSPCYSRVSQPAVLGCGYIDLSDGNKWKETSCTAALFLDPSTAIFPMFNAMPPAGKPACAGAGDYQTFVLGGPANQPDRIWKARGPNLLQCNLTFAGPRPDGLYGPTWVKMRVGIDKAENGDNRRGFPESEEFYVPIDGDLRTGIDVDVDIISSVEQNDGVITFTASITLTNEGEEDAENVRFSVYHTPRDRPNVPSPGEQNGFPPQVHIESVTGGGFSSICSTPSAFAGGSFPCPAFTLEAAGDPLGGDVEFVEIRGRVLNASDMPESLVFRAEVPDDQDENNNEVQVDFDINFNSGSLAQTRAAMEVLAPLFDYRTASFTLTTCNVYRDDIYFRFEQIRQSNPAVFDNLAYGPITSGPYTAAGIAAGHVGLVVYPKGTNYHDTGVIIHGTPSPSPLHWDAGFRETQIGTYAVGSLSMPDELNETFTGTYLHGYYYRTPTSFFPGYAFQEGQGCGFEGAYIDNAGDFARPAPPCIAASASCPLPPSGVTLVTESPVELALSNARGQRVETEDGLVVRQELDTGIHSMALPHTDGTYSWTLHLPEDDYDLELRGIANGPYRLTRIQYDEAGEAMPTVVESTTAPGQVDSFEISVGSPTDTDGDEIPDAEDNCPLDANPDQSDVEGDNVGDVCDNCPGLPNEDQLDNDEDGIGNVCDPTPNGDPVPGDINGDRVVDGQDFTALRAALGTCEGDAGYKPAADFTGDECVAYDDYQYWYGNFYGGSGEIEPPAPGC
ncbi:MAG: hypothetical protein Hals2KO_16840 [Halioglobus sp.]